MIVYKTQLEESCNVMVTMEYMDDYIKDIRYRVLHGQLPPEDMKIVERYKEFKQYNRAFREIDFKKLMNVLIR